MIDITCDICESSNKNNKGLAIFKVTIMLDVHDSPEYKRAELDCCGYCKSKFMKVNIMQNYVSILRELVK